MTPVRIEIERFKLSSSTTVETIIIIMAKVIGNIINDRVIVYEPHSLIEMNF